MTEEATKRRSDEATKRCSTAALLASSCLLAGCATTPAPPAQPPPVGDPPEYAALVAVQQRRLAGLARLQTEGSIELRWVDDDGRHFEAGDLDLWLELPRRTALRISKLTSEELFWLGSDDARYWFFDLLGSPKVLLTAGHDTELSAFGSTALTLRPLVLLDLLGMTPLPEAVDHAVEWDGGWQCWCVEGDGIGGRVRIGFDSQTMLPARVEAIGPDGAVAAASTLSEYQSVEVPGRAPLDRPKFPERVEVLETGEQGSVTLFLREHTGDVSERRLARLFDLDVLTKALRPERVEER